MQDLKIKNAIQVEVTFGTVAAGQKYYFPDVPQLRNVTTHGLEAFASTQLTTTPNGKTVFSNTYVPTVMVVLSVGDNEDVYQIPYYTLISSNNGGFIREFADLKININKSYLQLNATGITAGHAASLVWYYKK